MTSLLSEPIETNGKDGRIRGEKVIHARRKNELIRRCGGGGTNYTWADHVAWMDGWMAHGIYGSVDESRRKVWPIKTDRLGIDQIRQPLIRFTAMWLHIAFVAVHIVAVSDAKRTWPGDREETRLLMAAAAAAAHKHGCSTTVARYFHDNSELLVCSSQVYGSHLDIPHASRVGGRET